MTGAKLMSVSQGSCSLPSIRERKERGIEREAHSDGNCPAIAFTLRVSCEGSLPKQKVPRTSREK